MKRCEACGQSLPQADQPPPALERMKRYVRRTLHELTDEDAWNDWMRRHHG